jgi:hypothetical protein
MGQIESNTTAYLDREVMNFVFTCFESHGAPIGPLWMWEQVLYHVFHHVKTVHRVSDVTYEYSDDSPIRSPGQGSHGGPTSCSPMTSLLIKGMDRLCHGLTFCHPSQEHQCKTMTNMFIDDASNCVHNFVASWLHCPPDMSTVLGMLQHDSQTWERLLWTSGGMLSLTKCLCYIISWAFDSKGQAKMTAVTDI